MLPCHSRLQLSRSDTSLAIPEFGGVHIYISFSFIESDIYASLGLACLMESANHGNLVYYVFFAANCFIFVFDVTHLGGAF